MAVALSAIPIIDLFLSPAAAALGLIRYATGVVIRTHGIACFGISRIRVYSLICIKCIEARGYT